MTATPVAAGPAPLSAPPPTALERADWQIRLGRAIEGIAIPVGAIGVALVLFGLFLAISGSEPLTAYALIWRGAFGTWFSWQNTLQKAAPLLLVGLATALPAWLGLVVIGGEGALVLGGLATAVVGPLLGTGWPTGVQVAMLASAMIVGALWIMLPGALRHWRGVNETISSLLLNYIAIAIMNQLVEGTLRDPASINKPSTVPLDAAIMIGSIPGLTVHWGLAFGLIFCAGSWILMSRTRFGFAARVAGGNIQAARMAGLSIGTLILVTCGLAGAAAGLAGALQVAAVQGSATASLAAGYGYTGILVAFLARQNPIGIIPVSLLLGGINASNGLLQRHLDLPDATVMVLQGIVFVVVLAGEALAGRLSLPSLVLRRRAALPPAGELA